MYEFKILMREMMTRRTYPFVMRLVDVLVDERPVEDAVDPVDAIVREQ